MSHNLKPPKGENEKELRELRVKGSVGPMPFFISSHLV